MELRHGADPCDLQRYLLDVGSFSLALSPDYSPSARSLGTRVGGPLEESRIPRENLEASPTLPMSESETHSSRLKDHRPWVLEAPTLVPVSLSGFHQPLQCLLSPLPPRLYQHTCSING